MDTDTRVRLRRPIGASVWIRIAISWVLAVEAGAYFAAWMDGMPAYLAVLVILPVASLGMGASALQELRR